MLTSPRFSGQRFAVLGLARSGLASVASLLAGGAEVTAWDSREEAREPVAAAPVEHAQAPCVELLQQASLGPLSAEEAARLRKNCQP